MVTEEIWRGEGHGERREEAAAGPGDGVRAVAREGAGMRRYLLTVAGVVGVLYLLPFLVGRTEAWDRWNPYFYARPLNYAFETAGEDADVVVFGDSTAVLGVDPRQMSEALGVKVLNLVNSLPSLLVNDDLTLRRYLGRNRPPKVIVFYFAPWDFDYGHTDFSARPVFEGEEVLLRWGTAGEMLAFARRRPLEVVRFPLRFYSLAVDYTVHRTSHAGQEAELVATRGHVDNPDPTVLERPCRFPQELLDRVRFDWVRSLGARYARPGTRVLFYVAPVPACGNAGELLRLPFGELPAAAPRLLPPEDFASRVAFVHPRPVAVEEATRGLIEAVRPVLGSEGR